MKPAPLNIQQMKPLIPLWTGHSQTLLGHLISSDPFKFSTTEEILTLPDGDQILLKYRDQKSSITLSLYHGLGGDSDADYIRRSSNIAHDLGWNIVLVNHRCASNKAPSQKTYHSGRGEDADAVIQWSRQKFQNSKQVVLGFSMSGSILLNLLTSRYGEHQPDAAIIVNAPLDLNRASKLLTTGFSRIYDYRFYRILKKLVEQKENLKLPSIGTTRKFDDLYTSKANGFIDAQDYYMQCSVKDYLNRIKVPTYVLSSEDDPFIDIRDYKSAQWSEKVHLHISRYGGHMGYYSRKKDPQYGRRWLDQYLVSVFDQIQRKW